MKKNVILAALALSSAGAFAQYHAGEFTIQPKIGLNCSNFTNYDDEKDWKAGLAVGVEGEYHINNWLGISAGLMYSQQGAKFINFDHGDDYGGKDLTLSTDYINIPMLANFYVAKGLSLKAGLQSGYKVNSKIKISTSSLTADYFFKMKSVDWSIPMGIAYEYQGFIIDARYILGVTAAIKNTDIKNQVFQLTFGYKFKLK